METPGWIIAMQWASRGVLVLLAGLSVWSVAIMVDRYRTLLRGGRKPESLRADAEALAEARRLIDRRDWKALGDWTARPGVRDSANPRLRLQAGALKAALDCGARSPEPVAHAVRSYLATERTALEHGLTTLATLGSNAPFIGLFGTVLGIIQAFGSLAAQSSPTASVMSGISEALIATAVGLFVAIPAVVAYNVLSRRLKVLLTECDSLRDFYLSRLQGHGG